MMIRGKTALLGEQGATDFASFLSSIGGRESKTIRILAHWTSIRILNLFLVPEPIESDKISWLALAHYLEWEKKLTGSLPKTSGNFVPGLIFKLRIRISLFHSRSPLPLMFNPSLFPLHRYQMNCYSLLYLLLRILFLVRRIRLLSLFD